MKMYWKSGGTAPPILNLRPWLLYPHGWAATYQFVFHQRLFSNKLPHIIPTACYFI